MALSVPQGDECPSVAFVGGGVELIGWGGFRSLLVLCEPVFLQECAGMWCGMVWFTGPGQGAGGGPTGTATTVTPGDIGVAISNWL